MRKKKGQGGGKGVEGKGAEGWEGKFKR